MLKLYKYMPFSTLLKFLDDPCLRVTPSYCQNDPFEFGYSESDLKELDLASESRNFGENLRLFSNLHGIISLTASNSNILMWSHYSEDHRGAVVELLIDENNPQSLFINSTGPYSPPFTHSDFLFDKVNYTKKRSYDINKAITNIDLVKNHYYFTKAKQWSYEKEYRFITPLTWINRIIFNNEGVKRASIILKDYLGGIICLTPNCREEDRKYELNSTCLEYLLATNTQLIVELWKDSKGADTMFFIRLNTGVPGISSGCVGNIYLGCKSNEKSLISAIENHDDNPDSIHQKYYDLFNNNGKNVFKGSIDENIYKLNFKELTFSISD